MKEKLPEMITTQKNLFAEFNSKFTMKTRAILGWGTLVVLMLSVFGVVYLVPEFFASTIMGIKSFFMIFLNILTTVIGIVNLMALIAIIIVFIFMLLFVFSNITPMADALQKAYNVTAKEDVKEEEEEQKEKKNRKPRAPKDVTISTPIKM